MRLKYTMSLLVVGLTFALNTHAISQPTVCNGSGEKIDLFEVVPGDDGVTKKMLFNTSIEAARSGENANCVNITSLNTGTLNHLYLYARNAGDNDPKNAAASKHDWQESDDLACAPAFGTKTTTTWSYDANQPNNIQCEAGSLKIHTLMMDVTSHIADDYTWYVPKYMDDDLYSLTLEMNEMMLKKHGG